MATRGHIIGCGAYRHKGKSKQRFVLAVIDLDALQPKAALADMRFLGHGITIDPLKPDHAAVFEKKGKGACYVDLKKLEVVKRITTEKNQHFYGHGAYSADASLLYAAEALLDDAYKGMLVVRDGRTFKHLGEFPTYGTAPHDCMLLEDGKTMVITNGGGLIDSDDMPCVTYVDVATEKLLDKIELESPRFNTGHLAMTAKHDLAVVSAPRDGLGKLKEHLGAVSLKPAGEPMRTMTEPEDVVGRMLGEALSVVINESDGTVACTHPDGGQLSMWNMYSGELVRAHRTFQEPRGISMTLDGKFYVVSHTVGATVGLSLIDAETREHVPGFSVKPSMTSGSHIITYDLAAVISAATVVV
jgi:hypothetical protein